MIRRFNALALPAVLLGGALALPVSFNLDPLRHEPQRLNNCGPVTAMSVLSHFGIRVTQTAAANALKDDASDPQVSSLELYDYLTRFGLSGVIRYGGTPELIRELVAAGFPVVVQQRLQSSSNTAHFRTVYGYTSGTFLTSDPLLGADLRLNVSTFADLWHYYNGEYLIMYRPSQEAEIRAILGDDFSIAGNWQRILRVEQQNVIASPNDPYAWWGLGKAQLRLGNAPSAARSFDKAVQIGVPTEYYLYRQEAFEAWNKVGDYRKTLDKATQTAERFDKNSKELRQFSAAARRGLGG